MGVVCLCPLGPRSPFLNESWLLFITCNHISNCNVRAMPHLHNECWKWVLKQKAKPEIPPAGEMIAWQVCKLYNGISSYLSYKRYQNIKNNGLFFPVRLGYSWHSPTSVLYLRGSGIRIMCNRFVFPPAGFVMKLVWWKHSVNSKGSAHTCWAECCYLKWSSMLWKRASDASVRVIMS